MALQLLSLLYIYWNVKLARFTSVLRSNLASQNSVAVFLSINI